MHIILRNRAEPSHPTARMESNPRRSTGNGIVKRAKNRWSFRSRVLNQRKRKAVEKEKRKIWKEGCVYTWCLCIRTQTANVRPRKKAYPFSKPRKGCQFWARLRTHCIRGKLRANESFVPEQTYLCGRVCARNFQYADKQPFDRKFKEEDAVLTR
ncbi:hypothetical protein ANTQUA_LOCUS3088 [Anthophora quadrimaculata]